MIVGVARLDIRLFNVHSLKQKRSEISRLLSRLRSKFPLSLAEVGLLDLHQRALIGASMCAGNEKLINAVFKNMEKEIESSGLVEIIALDIEYLHYGDEIQ